MTDAPQSLEDPISGADEVIREIGEDYDHQVYTSNAFPFSSPGHLRAAAHLYGLGSVPLARARVLELGCAGGGNLLPFALAYPEAQVVGVDLSPVQIEQGQQIVQRLELKNLQLQTMSLTDITPEFGQFDYIISHGVFSWVPPEVRQAMLRIVHENLSPNGLAYISYNTYPGWKAGDIVRDAMLLHSHGVQSDDNRLASAKAVLRLLSDGIAAGNPLAPSMRAAVAQLEKHSNYYIAHEYLERFNNPCYLLEFVDQAQQHGLTHVGDAEAHLELAATYGQNVQLNHSLIALGKPREMRQQYLDFAVGRNFRKSLIVHQARADEVLNGPDTARLADLRWAACYGKTEPDTPLPAPTQLFVDPRGRRIQSRDPLVIQILATLKAAWPRSLTIADLAQQAGSTPGEAAPANAILKALQTLFQLNALHYTLEPSPYDSLPQNTGKNLAPRLVPGLAELLAATTRNASSSVAPASLWHTPINVRLKAAERFLLPLIDGTTSRRDLASKLTKAWHDGQVEGSDGQSLKGQRNLDARADKVVHQTLELLQRVGARLC